MPYMCLFIKSWFGHKYANGIRKATSAPEPTSTLLCLPLYSYSKDKGRAEEYPAECAILHPSPVLTAFASAVVVVEESLAFRS